MEKTVKALLFTRALAALVAGFILLLWPRIALGLVAVLFGIVLLIEGIERLVMVLRYRSGGGGGNTWVVIGAVLRIILGVLILANPVGVGSFWVTLIFILAGVNLVLGALFSFWREPGYRDNVLTGSGAVFTLLLGIVLIIMALAPGLLIFRIGGVLLILAAIQAFGMGMKAKN